MKKIKIINICYFFVLLILIGTSYISDLFQNYSHRELNKILVCIFIFLLVFSKKNFKFNLKKDYVFIFFFIFLKRFYLSYFFIFISKYIKRKVRLKQLFFILCFFYISILVMNGLDILDFNNLKYGIRKFDNFAVYRHALGFRHPNTAMSLLLPIFFLLYYIYYERFSKLVIGIILVIGSIIFKLTFSRTTFLLILLFIILILMKDKYIFILKKIFLIEGIIIGGLSIVLPIYFTRGLLNEILSWRLFYFYYYLRTYKLEYFGNRNLKLIYDELPLDNIYLRILFENGVIPFIIFLFLTYYIMKIFFKFNDLKSIRIFSIILIFGFMEHMAFHYYMNIIIFILSEYIYNLNLEKIKT